MEEPAIAHCKDGHELDGHTIRIVGFKDEVFTLSYAYADQWLVYDKQGVQMLRCSVAEMMPYITEGK